MRFKKKIISLFCAAALLTTIMSSSLIYNVKAQTISATIVTPCGSGDPKDPPNW